MKSPPFLEIECASRSFFLRTEQVGEVILLPSLFQPQGLPKPLRGFCVLGGDLAPVLDLALLLGLPECEPAPECVLVLSKGGGSRPAWLADRAVGLVDSAGWSVETAGLDALRQGIFSGIAKNSERQAPVLDVSRLLDRASMELIEGHRLQAAARLALFETGSSAG